MDNLLNVAFEAHNAERNHHRHYEITIGKDLLDDWTVSIRYGRAGQGGRVLRYAGQDAGKLQSIVKERLVRRLSAPRRIGCAYRMKELSTIEGFETATWLPITILRGLLSGVHERESTAVDDQHRAIRTSEKPVGQLPSQ